MDEEHEQLAKEKLQLELESLRRPTYKRPTFWFTLLSVMIALVGVVGQSYLSRIESAEAKKEVREAREKVTNAELEYKQVSRQLETANDQFLRFVSAQARLYSKTCTIGGEIVTAKDPQSARKAFEKFKSSELSLIMDREIAKWIEVIGKQIDKWQESDEPPQKLKRAVLGLSRASRAKWEEDAKEIGEIDQKLKDELYGEAVAVTRQLAAAQTKESAKEDRKEFWRLYYGALVLVESPEIEGAMVGFGNALNEWTTEGPPHTGLRLAKLADKLKQQVDIEVKGRSTE